MGDVIGGVASVKVNGVVIPVKGEWTINVGFSKLTVVLGAETQHGFTSTPQAGTLTGMTTNRDEVDIEALLTAKGAIINLLMAGPTGDTFVLTNASQTGEGAITTGEGEIALEFTGLGSIIKGLTP